MSEDKLIKLLWLKYNQIRYNIFYTVQPVLKDICLKNLELFLTTIPVNVPVILHYLKEHTLTNYKQLSELAVYDVPGKSHRFSCIYLLSSLTYNSRFLLSTKTDEVLPIYTSTGFFKSADWLEREVWDLFGVFPVAHPDLRRILSDYGFSGHPLRKDFPLTGFKEIRYNDSKGHIVPQPVEIAQELRIFTLENPWIFSSPLLNKN